MFNETCCFEEFVVRIVVVNVLAVFIPYLRSASASLERSGSFTCTSQGDRTVCAVRDRTRRTTVSSKLVPTRLARRLL